MIKRRMQHRDISAFRKFSDNSCLFREMKMESVGGLIDGIRRGETTARAGVASALEAADKLNEKLNAFLEIDRQGALKRADQIDALDQTDQASLPLAGVPIAIKDNICVRGMQTS
ncbi:MAG: hypothetical protein DMF71_17890, partial [Acidobacteria bacterium]